MVQAELTLAGTESNPNGTNSTYQAIVEHQYKNIQFYIMLQSQDLV